VPAVSLLGPQSLGLLTDLYELTMAYAYQQTDVDDHEAAFHLFFRKHPFGGGYAVSAGLQPVIDAIQKFRFDEDDLAYLGSLRGNDERPLFDSDFLDLLRDFHFSGDVDAVPEGTVVFAHEPLVRVCGPLLQCQLLESVLLCLVNFQTLIATSAARICTAARGEPVLEFGLRRAHGMDGAIAASRAAYIGGCAATSNVMAGRLFNIPVKGTHAHSWVMTFGDELTAFRNYASALPNNCVFLVDTYDTLAGVQNAIQVGRELREQGHEMVGIRLDSGDLTELSIKARRLLDDAGFPDAAVVGSNDLDESLIESLKEQGAVINVWGVGTKLVTAYDDPALGGVYKLTAVRKPGGEWQPRIKLSEQTIKISNPGVLQVRRFLDDGFCGDVIYEENLGLDADRRSVDVNDPTRRHRIPQRMASEELLVPVFRNGRPVYSSPSLHEIRERTLQQLNQLPRAVKRRLNPQPYRVGLDARLYDLKTRLIEEVRERAGG